MSPLEVVSAVIIRNGRILLTQRKHDKDYPFDWECPGGKVEGNESHHDALRRELQEELGLDRWLHDVVCPEDGKPVLRIPPGQTALWGDYVERKDQERIFLLFYPTPILDWEQPHALEWQGLGWFTVTELQVLSLTPGNQAALRSITKYFLSQNRHAIK